MKRQQPIGGERFSGSDTGSHIYEMIDECKFQRNEHASNVTNVPRSTVELVTQKCDLLTKNDRKMDLEQRIRYDQQRERNKLGVQQYRQMNFMSETTKAIAAAAFVER